MFGLIPAYCTNNENNLLKDRLFFFAFIYIYIIMCLITFIFIIVIIEKELEQLITIADSLPKGDEERESLIKKIRIIQQILDDEAKALANLLLEIEYSKLLSASEKLMIRLMEEEKIKLRKEKEEEKMAAYINSFYDQLKKKADELDEIYKSLKKQKIEEEKQKKAIELAQIREIVQNSKKNLTKPSEKTSRNKPKF